MGAARIPVLPGTGGVSVYWGCLMVTSPPSEVATKNHHKARVPSSSFPSLFGWVVAWERRLLIGP